MSTPTATDRLAKLSDPVKPTEIAEFLGIGIGSVYESMRRFDAARLAGEKEAARRFIPCVHLGGVLQADGTYKSGRFIVPRDAFVRWYTWMGLDAAELDEMYGEES